MGEPFFKQKELFRRAGVVCFSSNYELYADMSNRVMTTLEEMSPRVEIYSTDEAFCDLTEVRNCRDLTDFGKEIRAAVLKRTHLTVGVGIAQTKTLAKLANHAAKKWQRQTGGVVDLSNIDCQRPLLAIVPVEDEWGAVGVSAWTSKTALDLSEQSTWIIRKQFNVVINQRWFIPPSGSISPEHRIQMKLLVAFTEQQNFGTGRHVVPAIGSGS